MALAVMPDDTSGNDSMGAVTTAPAPGEVIKWMNQAASSGEARITVSVEAA